MMIVLSSLPRLIFRGNFLVAISLLTIASLGCSSQITAQDIDSSSSEWISSCNQFPELCVPRCQRDPEFCATQLNTYLISTQENELNRFKSWKLFPGTEERHSNEATPMHGAYLTLRVNDTAYNYINSVINDGKSGTLDYVDFPNGSIIVKENFTTAASDPNDKLWLTVMWKLDGYCHADFGGAGPCVGGEWFYYLYRFGGFKQFDGQPALGKAQAFCVDCHGPVQKADWLWTLFVDLKDQLPATSIVPSEQAAIENVVKYCEGTPLDPTLPGDVALNPATANNAQLMFDCLSWRTFVALNWPAKEGERGIPDTQKNIGDAADLRVWESYRTMFETFQPANPEWNLDNVNWNDPVPFDPVCGEETGNKVLRMSAKNRSTPILNETHQAFGNQFNILVDQNGNQLHFEVLINRDEFEFFKQNKYANTGNYDVGGPLEQLSWQAEPLHFPDNIRGLLKQGAVEIKAAWRVMCTDDSCIKKDDLSRYYVQDVQIYKPDSNTNEICTPAKVGLVGMHIGHKTFWTPQWVWSTFEHIENVPEAGSNGIDGVQYSLFSKANRELQPTNAECATQRPGALPPKAPGGLKNGVFCPNSQLICNSNPHGVDGTGDPGCKDVVPENVTKVKGGQGLIPNQVTRIDPITSSPLNNEYAKALQDQQSPFAYFRLVNTQWPLNGRGTPVETTINMRVCGPNVEPPCYTTVPKGLRLRNTTMETFQVSYNTQNTNPDGQISSSGCMQCHGVAGLDFSFAWTDGTEEVVPINTSVLSQPPSGSYRASCYSVNVHETTLRANCLDNVGAPVQASLASAHLCSGDIANINGKLLCNPPLGSFTLTCSNIDVAENVLSASCLNQQNISSASTLDISGYSGVIENCNGKLTKGRCP